MTNKTEDKFYFGKPGQSDLMATPMGEHGAIGKLVSRAIQDGAAAYRAGKPAVLNALDPKYKGMSAKELEIYGNFWMRGWDGERVKDASAKPIGRGIDFPGMRFSRPGQPEQFDASSLNRGNFAEASTSPMLGKLLAAKVMPEGGWRAVQVGSDTLVISFEDADLASDFGRRVATKGYNATSPVQAIGRYWNVEVKNDGK